MSVNGKYLTAILPEANRAPSGFTRIGNLLIDTNPGDGDYTAANFIGGVMSNYDSSGYIIITDTDNAGVVGRSTGNNSGIISQPNQPTFWVSPTKDDAGFLFLVNRLPARSGQSPFDNNASGVVAASNWLSSNRYWTSYVAPVLSLDAGNSESYPGTGTVWTDLVDGKEFNLLGNPSSGVPTYYSEDGGKILFYAPAGHYAICNTSLPSMTEFTLSVWHNWTGGNTGGLPCIISEIYPSSINYFLGNLQGDGLRGGYFNGGFQMSPVINLTANNWYHIVVTCDASQVVKIYLNNTLISTTSTTGGQPSSSNAGIRLMRRWDFAENWGGYLSTVAIYDKALESGQISSIYNATKSRYGY
jgi:hypothetical protein